VVRFRHVFRQLVPDWKFILKWVSIGTFAITALTGIALMWSEPLLRDADKRARKERDQQIAQAKREAQAVRDHEAEVWEFTNLEAHARGNWETWKSQFTTDADGIACAYGHIFNKTLKQFEVSCQIGPKGHLPTTLVVCNQNSCKVAPPTASAPEPKK
jgi:hypothetical protein